MLIKVIADFKLENVAKVPLELFAGDFIDIPDGAAEDAIKHGVAKPATVVEAEEATPKPKWMPQPAKLVSEAEAAKPKTKKSNK